MVSASSAQPPACRQASQPADDACTHRARRTPQVSHPGKGPSSPTETTRPSQKRRELGLFAELYETTWATCRTRRLVSLSIHPGSDSRRRFGGHQPHASRCRRVARDGTRALDGEVLMTGKLAGAVGTLVVVGGLLSTVCTLTSQGAPTLRRSWSPDPRRSGACRITGQSLP